MPITLALLGRVAVNALALVLIGLALHAAPVREYVRAVAAARASRDTGVPVSIGELRYNLFTLVFEADNVAMVPPPAITAPSVLARRVTVDLSWHDLLVGAPPVERAVASGVDIAASSSGGIDVDMLGLSLMLERSAMRDLEGRMNLLGPASIHAGLAAGPLTSLHAAVAFDGRTLLLDQMRIGSAGLEAVMTGTVDPFDPVPRVSIRGTWRGRVPELCETWSPRVPPCDGQWRGALNGRFTLEGPLTSPVFRFEVSSDGFAANTAAALEGEAMVSSDIILISRLERARQHSSLGPAF